MDMRSRLPVVWGMLMVWMWMTTVPAYASSHISLPGNLETHFWAAASLDGTRTILPQSVLPELRALYRLEQTTLQDYKEFRGFHIYPSETTGRLWAIHQAIARREHLIGLVARDWGLPQNAMAAMPLDYVPESVVTEALTQAEIPEGALGGLPIFLAPMEVRRVGGWTLTGEAPWLDEAIVLFAGADQRTTLHELGHAIHMQVLSTQPDFNQYIKARSAGSVKTGSDWADSHDENVAEDYRTYITGGSDHRGNWGPLTNRQRQRLGALLHKPAAPSVQPGFLLDDGVSERHWQPLTGLQFVTDQAQVTLRTQTGDQTFHGEICTWERCTALQGSAPFTLTLPTKDVYHVRIARGATVWMEAVIARVDPSAEKVSAPVYSRGSIPLGATASKVLQMAAAQNGWGEFPLAPSPTVLGNGWSRDPGARALAWARLTGVVSPSFPWQYAPQDLLTAVEVIRMIAPLL